MSTAVALFGLYSRLPAVIRNAGRQPGFTGGHCVLVYPGGPYVPPWLDELTAEPGKVADCVPVCGVRGINLASSGKQAPCTPAEREALQVAMGTQDVGATEVDLAAGISRRYGRSLVHGQSWAAIAAALGGPDVLVRLGDPLGTHDLPGVRVGDLQAYSAGLQSRYVLFPLPVQLPDTSTGGLPVWTTSATPADENVRLPIGTIVWDAPGGGHERFRVTKASTVHAVLQVPGWWGYVLGAGGVVWVAQGGLVHAPRPSYDQGVSDERTAATKAVQASKP